MTHAVLLNDPVFDVVSGNLDSGGAVSVNLERAIVVTQHLADH